MAKTTNCTKTSREPETPVEPVPEPVTVVPVAPAKTAEEIEEARWAEVELMRREGTLRGHLIQAVRTHATARIAEDEDVKWSIVPELRDEEIWVVIEWCDFPRGAISMMGKALNKRAANTVAQ